MEVYLVSKNQVKVNILKLIDFYLSVEILQSIITTLYLLSLNFIESIYLSIFLINRLTYFDHQKKSKTSDRIFLKILVEINLEALCPNKTKSKVRNRVMTLFVTV